MTPAPGLQAITASLRRAVLDYYDGRGEPLAGTAGQLTLDTNSTLVERRGRPLLEMLARQARVPSVEGRRLVDLGCGFGALSVFFAAQGANVTGIDVNGSRFEVGAAVGREHGQQLTFARGSMHELPLPSEGFDLAVMNNSLCYVTDTDMRRRCLREAFRVLQPGGWLIVRNPNRLTPIDPFTGLPLVAVLDHDRAAAVARRLRRPRSHVRLTSPWGGRAELRAAGFVEVAGAAPPKRRMRSPANSIARYLHVLGRRPGD